VCCVSYSEAIKYIFYNWLLNLYLHFIFKIEMCITLSEECIKFRQIGRTNIRRKTPYFDPRHKYFLSSEMTQEFLQNWKLWHWHINRLWDLKNSVCWGMTPCCPVDRYQPFGWNHCLHLQATMHHILAYHNLNVKEWIIRNAEKKSGHGDSWLVYF
jgi:hypothetical protein